MATEGATKYFNLAPSQPTGQEAFAEGDDHLRMIKSCIQAQWPNFTTDVACNPTPAEINALDGYETGSGTIEERLAALEAKASIGELPVEAYDFNSSWWEQSAAIDPNRMYSGTMHNSALSNQPWSESSSDTYTIVAQRWVNDGVQCAINVLWRRGAGDKFSEMFFRQATSSSGLSEAPWMRGTFAHISSGKAGEGANGNIEYTSVCPEQAARCP